MARHYSPSTIFFDEIDALMAKRGRSNEVLINIFFNFVSMKQAED